MGEMGMILKDDEYLKRNMLTVYYKHEAKYLNRAFYRFMGEQEFVTLLKIISCTLRIR